MPRFHRPVNRSGGSANDRRYSRDMTRPWRRWIAGLLMVTLPLQAAIAAAGLCCLPHWGEPMAAAASDAGAVAPPSPCHEAHVAGMAEAEMDLDTGLDTAVERCHACAACATVVALPAGATAVHATGVAASPRPWTPLPLAVRAAPPPEPPPRA